jgi:hypothetical protein
MSWRWSFAFLFSEQPLAQAALRGREQSSANARHHFLKRLSNAARASLALRGAGMVPLSENLAAVPDGNTSRATVTRGEKSSQVLP